jgi:APA family basic amino acid/polyamine antiporter
MPRTSTQFPLESEAAAGPVATLSLWDAVSLIVGVVIGAGIYETAPIVFSNVSGPGTALLVWLLGGALSLVGACCYAELASTYPRSGGDYVYLRQAFGPLAGFLFGWSQLAVILTGSIGMMAYVFADYSSVFGVRSDTARTGVAALAVTVLTTLNILSVGASKWTQNLLTLIKVAGLSAIALVGFGWALDTPPRTPLVPAAPAETSLGLALILVLYTYGGWNDAAFVAAEVRRRRDLSRALLLGTALISLIYLVVNAAFLAVLGFDGARSSRAIAADVLRGPFGETGAALISVLVMVSALGAVNALILTGARVHNRLGGDFSALAVLGRWNTRRRSPVGALLVQAAVTLSLMGLVGTATGRAAIDSALGLAGAAPAVWSGHGGFDTLLRCSAPVFWLFFLFTGLSMLVLRYKDPDRPRPFRAPLHPLLPLVFSGTCLYMLVSAVDYAGHLTIVGIALMLLGLPLYFASKQRSQPSFARSELGSAAE